MRAFIRFFPIFFAIVFSYYKIYILLMFNFYLLPQHYLLGILFYNLCGL